MAPHEGPFERDRKQAPRFWAPLKGKTGPPVLGPAQGQKGPPFLCPTQGQRGAPLFWALLPGPCFGAPTTGPQYHWLRAVISDPPSESYPCPPPPSAPFPFGDAVDGADSSLDAGTRWAAGLGQRPMPLPSPTPYLISRPEGGFRADQTNSGAQALSGPVDCCVSLPPSPCCMMKISEFQLGLITITAVSPPCSSAMDLEQRN